MARDRERGILIVVRDSGTSFPGQFPRLHRWGKAYSNHGCGSGFKLLGPVETS